MYEGILYVETGEDKPSYLAIVLLATKGKEAWVQQTIQEIDEKGSLDIQLGPAFHSHAE